MPEERKITIGPYRKPDPVDLWTSKWFGGGPLGSAAFSPQRWFGAPGPASSWQSPVAAPPEGVIQYGKAAGPEEPKKKVNPWVEYFRQRKIPSITILESMIESGQYDDAAIAGMAMQLLERYDTEQAFALKEKEFAGGQELATQREQTRQNMALAEAMQAQFNRDWTETQRQKAWAARAGQPIAADVRAGQAAYATSTLGAGYMGAGSEGGGSWFPAAQAMAQARQELEQRSWGFEKMREQIMASTAPRDWVVKEKARLALNPYEAEKVNMQGRWGASIPQVPANPEEKYSGTPEVPQNVQPFMGKGTSFGAPLETPSGQAWIAAPWSTREALIGYSEALGHPEADLLGAMQAMRPNAPGRGTSWAPARRR